MLDPELRKTIDALWDKFWAGGLANPLMAIDQVNYLIFLKRIEDLDDQRARSAEVRGSDFESIFAGKFQAPDGTTVDAEVCRWSHWKHFPAEEMTSHMQRVVFPWLKGLAPSSESFTQYLRDAAFLIPKPSLLVEAVRVIDELDITDRNIDTQGDIYEYMLRRLNVAGQIGQFRTPRHIIRAMVTLADPKIGETILDPACGTAGFLIAAYQHMILQGTSDEFLEYDRDGSPHGLVGDLLSPQEWEWLRDGGIIGYDFDPTMVRIGAMNMVLHGIERPNVDYSDALGKSFSHRPRANVILANPPFSGSVDSSDISDDFRLRSTKTELLFLELFEDLLVPGGRSVVIVPQGVLLAANDIQLPLRRRLLDENTLEAVISLPPWTFKPYASVATAILVFRKGGATERVWMYRVESDGYSKGNTREPIEDNDLPDMLHQWSQRNEDSYSPVPGRHRWVVRSDIRNQHDDLAPHLYVSELKISHDYPTALIKEVCTLKKGRHAASSELEGPYPLWTTAAEPKSSPDYDFEGPAVLVPLVSSTGHGHASIKRITYVEGEFAAATIVAVVKVNDEDALLPRFLHVFLESHKEEVLVPLMMGAANVSLSLTKIGAVEIPLPPIEEQLSLIEGFDKVEESLMDIRSELEMAQEQRLQALLEFRGVFTA